MPVVRARVRRVMCSLLSDPAALPFLVAVYIAAGLLLVLTDYTLDDEGLQTYYLASWARQDFVPVFFFQRVKPVVSTLYAAVSAGGIHAMLIAHVVVAATAIPLLAATARALGHRLPNLPAVAVALSPLYFYGGAAGVSNVDGVVGIVLVLYLLCARRLPLAAGLVVGLLPWVRFELATFCAVMAFYALVTERDRPMLLGMAMFPLGYAAAGALYHHDVLWNVHYPPVVSFNPGKAFWNTQFIGWRSFLEPVAAVTPVAVFAAALSFGRLGRVERALLAYVALTAAAMNLLPMFHLGNFDTSPRYSLLLLPALALLVGGALEPWWEGAGLGRASLLVTALLAVWVATRQQDVRAAQVLIAFYALVLSAVWLRAGTFAVTLTVVLALAGPLLPLRLNMTRAVTAKYLDAMFAWLQAHPERSAAPIYTNSHLLAPFLAPRLPDADVYHLADVEMTRELTVLANPANGQRGRIRRLCASDLYGKTLLAPIMPEDLPANALLALRNDPRLSVILPAATWSPRLDVLVETPDYHIARLRPATAVAQ